MNTQNLARLIYIMEQTVIKCIYRLGADRETHQSGDVVQHLNLREEQKISLKHTEHHINTLKPVYFDQRLV